MIGDPSGTSAERNLLDRETLEANVSSIRSQLERFLDFTPGAGGAVLVNNLDWLGETGLIDFLRDTGKHFTIPYMLAKDSVQTRLDRGLSFTEFSYMLLQAADFEHLYRTRGSRAADGRGRPVGQHHGWPRVDPAARPAEPRTMNARSARTGLPIRCCCRRAARSSARARAASPFGSIRADVAVRVLPVLAQHR